MTTADLLEPGWTSRFVTANGVRLHVVEAGSPSGAPVILLHGFPEFWWAWRKQIGPLAAAGYRVIVPDMRGYHLSDKPAGIGAYHLDLLADDVVALADAIGIGRFHLVAHDWGGVVAWWVAARHAPRIERLVVMDAPHPDSWARAMRRDPAQALRSTYVLLFQLPRLPETLLGSFRFKGLRRLMTMSARPDAFSPGEMERYVSAWSQPGALTAMLNYYRALRRRHASTPPARITPPTLILWGENDTALGRPIAEEAVALCNRGSLRIIPGTSHWLHAEKPEAVTHAVLEHFPG